MGCKSKNNTLKRSIALRGIVSEPLPVVILISAALITRFKEIHIGNVFLRKKKINIDVSSDRLHA